MKLLKQYIETYGTVLNDDVLLVDSFLNHQILPDLMMDLAKDMQDHFKDKKITKIVTIETSGIAPSVFLGYLLHVPVVYFKKDASKILNDHCYQTTIHSFTKNKDYEIRCNKDYLNKDDHILLIDDFMANGEACLGAIRLIEDAHATLDGIGIVIEKAFQEGRKKVLEAGYDIYAQASIASLTNNTVIFE